MRRPDLSRPRWLRTSAVAALVLLGFPGVATAHGDLRTASPGPGDALSPGSTVVRLELPQTDPGAPLAVAITDPDGGPVPVGAPSVVGGDQVCAATVPLGPGVWTVDYAGSGVDGHRFGGRYAFEVVRSGGSDVEPGACSTADLAAAEQARTLEEMLDQGLQVPSWVTWGIGVLGLLALLGVVARIRRDHRSPTQS